MKILSFFHPHVVLSDLIIHVTSMTCMRIYFEEFWEVNRFGSTVWTKTLRHFSKYKVNIYGIPKRILNINIFFQK